MNFASYKGKRVLVTGHTGFKGSWLCEWLLMLGAEVHGFALKPPTVPSLFNQLQLARRLATHTIGDIRDFMTLKRVVKTTQADIIFHLAAQPLVRESYRTPRETFDANVMGTVNLLEAIRAAQTPDQRCAIICITTDKVYENDESGTPFTEDAPLGGSDPYSASKGACEIVIQSYRRSFFSHSDSSVSVASARAGNVIGGGDWAPDRIVPDTMRAFFANEPLIVRNTASTRPWQHVLEPLCGYLTLGEQLYADPSLAQAFNFGPRSDTVKTVGQLVRELQIATGGFDVIDRTDPQAPHEAKLLMLNSRKATRLLGWRPRWDFHRTLWETSEWYKGKYGNVSARTLCQAQINSYCQTEVK
ncbi:MAG: CDP-glucose 4,6-dehydratase [Kiritimatiellae bacterium]|nr:CDP-glucose 4,6-dehydratase [Kiritimatiellia bacterium]